MERKNLSTGESNPKYVDLLDEDQPIAGQKFVCLSFISPEKEIKSRENFLFDKFVHQWDLNKSLSKFGDFTHFLSYKYKLDHEDLAADLASFVEDESAKMLETTSIDDEYKTFLDKNEEKLNEQYNRAHKFQTSTRGLKVRGVFNIQDEAEAKCKKLRESDPNHDIFVGVCGVWIPFQPDAYKTGRIEFLEEELNQLHHEKLKNETEAKIAFEERVKSAKRAAIEENVRKARATGNTLTQTINEDGELCGVLETTDFDAREVSTEEGASDRNKTLLEKTASKKRI
jgi:hypothetical protein